VEQLKTDVVHNLNEYVSKNFKEGSTLGTVFLDGDSEITIRINISCQNLNFKNFWGGEWLSTYDINHALGSNDFSMVGRIWINNHYFESGNIQFNLNKNFAEEISATANDGNVAKLIIDTIARLEEEY